MSIENIHSCETPDRPLRLVNAGKGDIYVDGKWYSAEEWLEVLGVGQGYARYADRRPVNINWLLLGGEHHIQTTEDAQGLVEECYDDGRYSQPELQDYLKSAEHIAMKQQLEVPEGA